VLSLLKLHWAFLLANSGCTSYLGSMQQSDHKTEPQCDEQAINVVWEAGAFFCNEGTEKKNSDIESVNEMKLCSQCVL
jgi:hypothetical protein